MKLILRRWNKTKKKWVNTQSSPYNLRYISEHERSASLRSSYSFQVKSDGHYYVVASVHCRGQNGFKAKTIASGNFLATETWQDTDVVEFPIITQQPQGGDVIEGGSPLKLTVVASGPYLKYQWYRNGVALKGQQSRSSTLTVNYSASSSSSANYYVVVSNSPTSRVQSKTVKVRFLKRPRITQQPKGGDVIEGGSPLKLTVVASGPYLKYQWYRNRVALKGQQSRSSTLTVNYSASSSSSANYYVVVSNSPTSRVQSKTVKVRFLKKPQIVREPENLYLGFNESSQFSIQVTGYPTPMVTWYKDGNVIPHETGLTLFFERAQWPHRGSYFAEASNSEGSVRTKEVYLHLTIINEGKWNILLNRRGPASLVEVGKIDRDMDVKNGGSTK